MNFTRSLLSWYRKNKRELPWRQTKDPYRVWLSEIILQQTRIDQGLPYYEKIINRFPAIEHLAAADEQDVLKLWQGLGYYSRARNLHATARIIMERYHGRFPATYKDLRRLKGIGDYTAAAVASICFDLPHAVVDGNVVRFISRYSGIAEPAGLASTRKRVQDFAGAKLDRRNPGEFNQAMMEFGALVCTPSDPGCDQCIFRDSCVAFRTSMVGIIPLRKPVTMVRHRYLHYLVITLREGGTEYIFLNKRIGSDIWKNLYDFPCIERRMEDNDQRLAEDDIREFLDQDHPRIQDVSDEYIHLLTHQRLHARFYRVFITKMMRLPYLKVPLNDMRNYPVPKLIERYMAQHLNFS